MWERGTSKASQNCNNIAEQWRFSMMNFLMVAITTNDWPQIEKDIFGRMGRLHRSLRDGKRSVWTWKRTAILCSCQGKKLTWSHGVKPWQHTTIGSFLRTTGISQRALVVLSNSVTNSLSNGNWATLSEVYMPLRQRVCSRPMYHKTKLFTLTIIRSNDW